MTEDEKEKLRQFNEATMRRWGTYVETFPPEINIDFGRMSLRQLEAVFPKPHAPPVTHFFNQEYESWREKLAKTEARANRGKTKTRTAEKAKNAARKARRAFLRGELESLRMSLCELTPEEHRSLGIRSKRPLAKPAEKTPAGFVKRKPPKT